MLRRIATLAALTLLTAGTAAVAGSVPASAGSRFPASISIPNGFQPEGFTIGRGTSFSVGSLAGGPAADLTAFNNGIVATPDGRLIVVQMIAGRLVSIDPRTGSSRLVDLHGYSVVNGDGLVLRGRTLWVIRNMDSLVAVLHMDDGFRSGHLVREITSPLLRVPSTGDLFGRWLYVVNARFDVTPTPDTDYNVVRVPA